MKSSTKNVATEVSEQSSVMQLANLDAVPWYKKPNLCKLYAAMVPAILGCNMTLGYDGSIINGLQALKSWNAYYDYPQGAELGTMLTVSSLGAFVSLAFVAWINDSLGRKRSIILGSLIAIIGVVVQCCATEHNRAMYIGARNIVAFGGPISITAAASMTAELSYPTHRPLITGLYNNSWNVGALVAACVTLGCRNIASNWSWRLPVLLQMLPSLMQLTFIWFVPESPRWLIAKDRSEEAKAVLVKYHGEGDATSALAIAEFTEIYQVVRMDATLPKRRWRDALSSKGNRHRFFIAATVGLFHAWSGNGLTSYYLPKVLLTVGITDTLTQIQINIAMACAMLVSCCVAALGALRFRRRTIWLGSFGMMAVAYWILTALSATYDKTHTTAAASGTVAFIIIFQVVFSLAQPLQMIYTSEIFPYHLRSKGIVVEEFFNMGGGLFNAYVNPIALMALGWKYYIVYCCVIPAQMVVMYFLYPETKGPSLEELAIVFDGPSALDEKVSQVEHDDRGHRKESEV